MADENDMRAKIMAIMRDETLTDAEKAKKRQELLTSRWTAPIEDSDEEPEPEAQQQDTDDILTDNLKCAICMDACERPVTAPCQHNFCLKCFTKWTTVQRKDTCPTCRANLPAKFCQNPRINVALAVAIRMAKQGKAKAAAPKPQQRVEVEQRPDEAFTTERAVRAGRANAASGRIMVTIPNDHFGPILPQHDPERNRGVQVGDWWKDRLDCRQWGAHFPHVAGIAGQSSVGAQSVVLAGGYLDDRDEGEWFLYTGSGGRDLSGNKRTNNVQSFDQEFTLCNEALRVSCAKGLPVRVLRSYKEKRSAYAPTDATPVRYDGIYRIIKAWRKPGLQGPLVCRYLFVRADNEPAPWSSGETGDLPDFDLPAEVAKELKQAHKAKVHEIAEQPFWDYDHGEGRWGWAKTAPAPAVKAQKAPADPVKAAKQKLSAQEKLLKQFACGVCGLTLRDPLSTPCGHNFCKPCLDRKFEGIADVVPTARTMRVRHNPKPCPRCKADLAQFMASAQVNREMVAVVEKLAAALERAKQEAAEAGAPGVGAPASAEAAEVAAEQGQEQQEEEQQEEEQQQQAEEQQVQAEEQQQQQQQVQAAAGTSAAGEAGASAAPPLAAPTAVQAAPIERWAQEVAALAQEFPDFDVELVRSMLEDQGGDLVEVRFYLRRMQAQLAAAERKAKQPPGAQAKKAGKKAAAASAAAAQGAAAEAQEAQQQEDAHAGAAGSSEAAARKRKATAKPRGRKATAAAMAHEEAEQATAAEAIEVDAVAAGGSDTGSASAQEEKAAAGAEGSLSERDAVTAKDQQQQQQAGQKRIRGGKATAASAPAATKRSRKAAA